MKEKMMPRRILAIVLALLYTVTALDLNTEVRAQTPRRISAVERRSAEAAWTPFFRKFTAAVKTRDRDVLKAMMHTNFNY